MIMLMSIISLNLFAQTRVDGFDSYDAINVNRVDDIPMDYDGLMGVPTSFFQGNRSLRMRQASCRTQDHRCIILFT